MDELIVILSANFCQQEIRGKDYNGQNIKMATQYYRGRAFEYKVRDDLRKRGYFAMRSPASKSPVDIVAIQKGMILFVQCKLSGDLPTKEWNALFDLALQTDAIPVLAIKKDKEGIKYFKLISDRRGYSKNLRPKMEIMLSTQEICERFLCSPS